MSNYFSIFIPTYNSLRYLKACIDSALSQTYPHYNIIILDSGSIDGTIEYLQALNNDKIIIYTTPTRLGIEQNWGRIVNTPKNEFVTILGHDDILTPNFLETINNLILSNPAASVYHTHFNYINADGNTVRECKKMNPKIDEPYFMKLFLNNKIDSMGTGYIVRSKDYDAIGGISTQYPSLLFADFELWVNLISISYMAVAMQNCFSFRLHQSTTTTSSNEKFIIAFEKFITFLKTKINNPALKKSIEENVLNYIQFYCQALTHRFLKTPLHQRNKHESVKNILARCKQSANEILPNKSFNPAEKKAVKLALLIDSNIITRRLFLLFKQIFKNPILE